MCRLIYIYTIKMVFNKNRTQSRARLADIIVFDCITDAASIHSPFSHALCHTLCAQLALTTTGMKKAKQIIVNHLFSPLVARVRIIHLHKRNDSEEREIIFFFNI